MLRSISVVVLIVPELILETLKRHFSIACHIDENFLMSWHRQKHVAMIQTCLNKKQKRIHVWTNLSTIHWFRHPGCAEDGWTNPSGIHEGALLPWSAAGGADPSRVRLSVRDGHGADPGYPLKMATLNWKLLYFWDTPTQSGWWFGTWILFFPSYLGTLSHLTNSYFSEG